MYWICGLLFIYRPTISCGDKRAAYTLIILKQLWSIIGQVRWRMLEQVLTLSLLLLRTLGPQKWKKTMNLTDTLNGLLSILTNFVCFSQKMKRRFISGTEKRENFREYALHCYRVPYCNYCDMSFELDHLTQERGLLTWNCLGPHSMQIRPYMCFQQVRVN